MLTAEDEGVILSLELFIFGVSVTVPLLEVEVDDAEADRWCLHAVGTAEGVDEKYRRGHSGDSENR